MPKIVAKENPLFGKFAQVMQAVLHPHPASAKTGIDESWGDVSKLRYVDMFCGIGGFHSAADALGMKCVFACDIDADARKAYEHNYKLRPESDICRIRPETVPDHELMFAGFPCQPFSIIGSQEGFADARGTLFFELAKIIEAKQPRAIVLENVKQLRSHNNGKTLKRILEILKNLGYWADFHVLNALNFGVPQKRERIFIVAFKGGKPENFAWPTKKVPMRSLASLLEKDVDERHYVSDRIRKARRDAHTSPHKTSIWHENKAGNISSHPFSCALRAGASYNYLLVNGERRLTSREMLRLQGFPDTFEIVCTDSQTRKQAGNAVPVPMVQAVIECVLHARQSQSESQSKTTRQRSAA